VDVEAVLASRAMPLRDVLSLKIGDTLMLDIGPADLVTLRCGGVPLTEGRMGRISEHIAVRVTKPLRRPSVTAAALEEPGKQHREGLKAP
jgi:flagellar motor switch protein FliM